MKEKIDTREIAKEFAEKGLIPSQFVAEFAQVVEFELRRETMRFGAGLANSAAKSIFVGQILGQAA